MPRQSKRAGDMTGRQAEVLAVANREEQARRANEISMFSQVQAELDQEPVDLVPTETPLPSVDEGTDVEVYDVDVQEKIVSFRVNEDLEQVTIGSGKHYNFEEGRIYNAPAYIRDHLEEKGFIWH